MRPLLLAVGLLLFAGTAPAGSVCGVVRDASTQQAIAGAELTLFLDQQITALQAESQVDGSYCIDDVAPGTYDLRVRRDDYVTTWIEDVVVEDTATSIDVSWTTALRLDTPQPNPASGRIEFRFETAGTTPVRLRVFDVRGRLIRGWDDTVDGSTVVPWNLRTVDGRPLASGLYFVSLESGGQKVTRSFICVR